MQQNCFSLKFAVSVSAVASEHCPPAFPHEREHVLVLRAALEPFGINDEFDVRFDQFVLHFFAVKALIKEKCEIPKRP